MSTLRSWILPILVLLNAATSIAIGERAATLRQRWQVWDVRLDAQARLKHLYNDTNRGPRSRGEQAEPGEPPPSEQ